MAHWEILYCIERCCIVLVVIHVNRVILVKCLRARSWVVRVPLKGCIRSARITSKKTRNLKKNLKSCLGSNISRSLKCLEDVSQSEKKAKQVCWRLWKSLWLIFSSFNFFCLYHNSFQSRSISKIIASCCNLPCDIAHIVDESINGFVHTFFSSV